MQGNMKELKDCEKNKLYVYKFIEVILFPLTFNVDHFYMVHSDTQLRTGPVVAQPQYPYYNEVKVVTRWLINDVIQIILFILHGYLCFIKVIKHALT